MDTFTFSSYGGRSSGAVGDHRHGQVPSADLSTLETSSLPVAILEGAGSFLRLLWPFHKADLTHGQCAHRPGARGRNRPVCIPSRTLPASSSFLRLWQPQLVAASPHSGFWVSDLPLPFLVHSCLQLSSHRQFGTISP